MLLSFTFLGYLGSVLAVWYRGEREYKLESDYRMMGEVARKKRSQGSA
jgi:hypothetical protein